MRIESLGNTIFVRNKADFEKDFVAIYKCILAVVDSSRLTHFFTIDLGGSNPLCCLTDLDDKGIRLFRIKSDKDA